MLQWSSGVMKHRLSQCVISVRSSSWFYLLFLCLPCWFVDELENLHANQTNTCWIQDFWKGGSKAVVLLWILFVIIVSCLPLSYCLAFFLAVLWSPAGKGLTSWFSCIFVTSPYGVLGQVWYLIVSIPVLCLLPYFHMIKGLWVRFADFISLFLKYPMKMK